jgi:AraC-like DNA-binding protein
MEFRDLEQSRDENGSPVFTVQVFIEGLEGDKGTGFSKKEAQQKASKGTLQRLRREPQFIDAIFAIKADRTKMEEEPVMAAPDLEKLENPDFIVEQADHGDADRGDGSPDPSSQGGCDQENRPHDPAHDPVVTEAVERWKQNGYYREHNLTLGIVARQMVIPQRQLQEWLRQSEYGKLAGLVTTLRIEEAKRVLKEHPDWSTESVANYCGFSSREYFHRTFRQITGSTPANYQ